MDEPATVAQALRAAAARLESVAGSGRFDAALLLEHVTGLTREAFLRDESRVLSPDERAMFERLIEERAQGKPVPYLTGNVGFYGRTFFVDERVLVPRPESEHLIEAARDDVRARGKTAARIADIGTGSGALAITLAAELPDAWVFGTDISRDAIAVARRNAARANVFQQCTFLVGDLAAPLERFAPFDAIVANLPYIPRDDIPSAPNPVAFEPRVALDGGPDGLDLYRRLLHQLPPLLAPDATLFFEAAPGTIEALADYIAASYPAAHMETAEDYAGLDRVIVISGLRALLR